MKPDGNKEHLRSNQATFIENINGRLNYETHIILIIDDQESFRRLIAREVQHAAPGTLTMEAGDGYDALDKLADIRENFKVEPLLMVLDLEMPGMNGWDLLDHLRNEYIACGYQQGIPIIVLSSTSGERKQGWFKKSIHGDKAEYQPLVSVAKNDCVDPEKYDALGQQGLAAWVRHFVEQS